MLRKVEKSAACGKRTVQRFVGLVQNVLRVLQRNQRHGGAGHGFEVAIVVLVASARACFDCLCFKHFIATPNRRFIARVARDSALVQQPQRVEHRHARMHSCACKGQRAISSLRQNIANSRLRDPTGNTVLTELIEESIKRKCAEEVWSSEASRHHKNQHDQQQSAAASTAKAMVSLRARSKVSSPQSEFASQSVVAANQHVNQKQKRRRAHSSSAAFKQ